MAATKSKTRCVVVKLESYEGEDTYLRCGNDRQSHLYAIVAVDPDGTAEIVDSSYRTIVEALEAWPEAAPADKKRRRQSRSKHESV
jgi:hypothetical protein